MSTQRHLHRTAALAVAYVVFAATATGTAYAFVRTDSAHPNATSAVSVSVAQNAAAVAAAKATFTAVTAVVPTASPTPAKATEAQPKPTAVATSTPAAAAKPTIKKATAKTTALKPVTIDHYVDKPGSQAAIDKCNLVLWTHSPLWLAGHNWCGYQWMAYVATGTTVTVNHGLAAGTYVVTDHVHLSRQSGNLPSLDADLVLQTCIGDGTGLTLLKRV